MRAAPPAVEVTLGTGGRERALVAALYALAAGSIAAWLVARGVFAWHAALMPCAVLIGLAAGAFVVRPLQGRLRWDGDGWAHAAADDSTSDLTSWQLLRAVQLRWDMGGWLLLHAVPAPGRRGGWCALTAREAGPAWHGLRLAAYHWMPDSTPRRGAA